MAEENLERSFDFTANRVARAIGAVRASGLPRHVIRNEGKDAPHLHLIVGRRKATYFFRGRREGRDLTVKLGDAEGPAALNLEEARRACNEIAYGRNLAEVRRSRGKLIGVKADEVWARFLAEAQAGSFSVRGRGRRPLAAKTLGGYQSNWRKHLQPRFGSKDLGHLLQLGPTAIRDLGSTSPSLANQVLATVVALVEYARRRNIYSGPNPFRGPDADLRRFVAPRKTRLTEAQIAALWEAIQQEPAYWRDLFLLLSLTASRFGNIAKLKWSQVDFDEGVILHPAEVMKAREAAADPVTPAVRAILERRLAAVAGASDYVWPQAKNPDKPVRNPHHRWAKLRQRAGLPSLVIHELKHLAITWADRAQIPSRTVQRFAKHRNAATTQRYSHLDGADTAAASEAVAQVWEAAAAKARAMQEARA